MPDQKQQSEFDWERAGPAMAEDSLRPATGTNHPLAGRSVLQPPSGGEEPAAAEVVPPSIATHSQTLHAELDSTAGGKGSFEHSPPRTISHLREDSPKRSSFWKSVFGRKFDKRPAEQHDRPVEYGRILYDALENLIETQKATINVQQAGLEKLEERFKEIRAVMLGRTPKRKPLIQRERD